MPLDEEHDQDEAHDEGTDAVGHSATSGEARRVEGPARSGAQEQQLAALQRLLSVRQLRIMQLLYVEGLTSEETAKRVGMTAAAVRQQAARTRRAFRA